MINQCAAAGVVWCICFIKKAASFCSGIGPRGLHTPTTRLTLRQSDKPNVAPTKPRVSTRCRDYCWNRTIHVLNACMMRACKKQNAKMMRVNKRSSPLLETNVLTTFFFYLSEICRVGSERILQSTPPVHVAKALPPKKSEKRDLSVRKRLQG